MPSLTWNEVPFHELHHQLKSRVEDARCHVVKVHSHSNCLSNKLRAQDAS